MKQVDRVTLFEKYKDINELNKVVLLLLQK